MVARSCTASAAESVGDLEERAAGRDRIGPEECFDPEHPFRAHRRGLDHGAIRKHGHNREHAVVRKVHVLQRLAGLLQRLLGLEWNDSQVREKLQIVGEGERGEQEILRRITRGRRTRLGRGTFFHEGAPDAYAP